MKTDGTATVLPKLGTVTTGADGTWSFTLPAKLPASVDAAADANGGVVRLSASAKGKTPSGVNMFALNEISVLPASKAAGASQIALASAVPKQYKAALLPESKDEPEPTPMEGDQTYAAQADKLSVLPDPNEASPVPEWQSDRGPSPENHDPYLVNGVNVRSEPVAAHAASGECYIVTTTKKSTIAYTTVGEAHAYWDAYASFEYEAKMSSGVDIAIKSNGSWTMGGTATLNSSAGSSSGYTMRGTMFAKAWRVPISTCCRRRPTTVARFPGPPGNRSCRPGSGSRRAATRVSTVPMSAASTAPPAIASRIPRTVLVSYPVASCRSKVVEATSTPLRLPFSTSRSAPTPNTTLTTSSASPPEGRASRMRSGDFGELQGIPAARSCTRGKRWPVTSGALATLLLLSGCTSTGESFQGQSLEPGTALQALFNTAETGVEEIKLGDQYWFALSPMRNRSDEDLELLKAEVGTVPAGIKVTGRVAYSLRETDGLDLSLRDDDVRDRKAKDYSKNPILIKAKTDSDIYYMVRLTVVKQQPSIAKDCSITYRQEDTLYKQKVHCTYMLGTTG